MHYQNDTMSTHNTRDSCHSACSESLFSLMSRVMARLCRVSLRYGCSISLKCFLCFFLQFLYFLTALKHVSLPICLFSSMSVLQNSPLCSGVYVLFWLASWLKHVRIALGVHPKVTPETIVLLMRHKRNGHCSKHQLLLATCQYWTAQVPTPFLINRKSFFTQYLGWTWEVLWII